MFTANTLQQVDAIVAQFPYFKNIRDDVIMYGEDNPKEVLDLYLEGIEILDQNTYLTEIKQNREEISNLKTTIAEKDNILAEKDSEIAKLKRT